MFDAAYQATCVGLFDYIYACRRANGDIMHAGMMRFMDLKVGKAWELSPAVWHMIYKVQYRQLIQCIGHYANLAVT